MKRQRGMNVNGFEGAEMVAVGKKKAKTEVDQMAKEKEKLGKNAEEEEKKKEGKQMEMVGTEEHVMGWANWEENWPWMGDLVDEQMSWGSIWLPFWDMDFMGEAFSALYGDVVWDDDIWNLKTEIPNPFES